MHRDRLAEQIEERDRACACDDGRRRSANASASARLLVATQALRVLQHDDDGGARAAAAASPAAAASTTAQDLVDADPDEAPAHPGDEQEHEHRLEQEPDRPEPRRARARPGAEEEQRAEERRAEDVRVLAELDERELHPGVLDAEAGDELRLGLEDVERRAVLRGDASTMMKARKASWPITG